MKKFTALIVIMLLFGCISPERSFEIYSKNQGAYALPGCDPEQHAYCLPWVEGVMDTSNYFKSKGILQNYFLPDKYNSYTSAAILGKILAYKKEGTNFKNIEYVWSAARINSFKLAGVNRGPSGNDLHSHGVICTKTWGPYCIAYIGAFNETLLQVNKLYGKKILNDKCLKKLEKEDFLKIHTYLEEETKTKAYDSINVILLKPLIRYWKNEYGCDLDSLVLKKEPRGLTSEYFDSLEVKQDKVNVEKAVSYQGRKIWETWKE